MASQAERDWVATLFLGAIEQMNKSGASQDLINSVERLGRTVSVILGGNDPVLDYMIEHALSLDAGDKKDRLMAVIDSMTKMQGIWTKDIQR